MTHSKSIDAIKNKLTEDGWFVLPFVKKNARFKQVPTKGIVDLIAIKLRPTRLTKYKDNLEIVFFDAKSGSARDPGPIERRRLQNAVKNLRVGYNYVTYRNGVVEFRWKSDEYLRKIKLR